MHDRKSREGSHFKAYKLFVCLFVGRNSYGKNSPQRGNRSCLYSFVKR